MRLQYLPTSASMVRPRRSAKAYMWQEVAFLPYRAKPQSECKPDGFVTEGIDMIWKEEGRNPELICVTPGVDA